MHGQQNKKKSLISAKLNILQPSDWQSMNSGLKSAVTENAFKNNAEGGEQ